MIGTSLNQYQIIASIGAGGMGEVFRARDTRLNRDVAVKVLPRDFTSDAGRLGRFDQEAKTLATLNHPNILTVFDAGIHNSTPYLVAELLTGRTLREELESGLLPVGKATDYALQMVEGLAAAHAKGIIHRDLKPENIFITKDGRVKILDFGLARLREPRGRSAPAEGVRANSESPTMIDRTAPGVAIGTPAYMSPEQVRGEAADHRSDLFSFGSVFYEMLSGVRAFRRNSAVESMNAVLRDDPAGLSDGNRAIPAELERVVRRCLEKDPENRFQSAKDLAFAIDNSRSGPPLQRGASPRNGAALSFRALLPWAVAALCLTALLWTVPRTGKAPARLANANDVKEVRKFELTVPPPKRKTPGGELRPVISPDGKKFAYANGDGLWLRWLERTVTLLLVPGENISDPFWDLQSNHLGYFQGRKLHRIGIAGGNPAVVGAAPEEVSSGAAGAAWLHDRIVFTTGWSALLEVPAEGGRVTTALQPTAGEDDFHNCSALPNGRGVLFVIHRTQGIDTIAAWDPRGEKKVLLQIPSGELWGPVYSATGHVLFHRHDETGGIWAFPFSLEQLERTGEPFRVSNEGTYPSAARDGAILFGLMSSELYGARQLTWVDRSGQILGTIGSPMRGLSQPRMSPDGQRIIAASGESVNTVDLWMLDAGGGAIPLTRNELLDDSPHWWDDGRTILFRREGDTGDQLLAKAADGSASEQLVRKALLQDASRSGKYLVVRERVPAGERAFGYVEMKEEPRRLTLFPETFQRIRRPALSPDDRFLAYESIASGTTEIYVVEFPEFSGLTVVSRSGGYQPVWHPHGSELFYFDGQRRALMSAKLKADGRGFEEPTKAFDLPESIQKGETWWPRLYDVAPDGQRLLMLQKAEEELTPERAAKPNLRVVQNWIEEFPDKRSPAGGPVSGIGN